MRYFFILLITLSFASAHAANLQEVEKKIEESNRAKKAPKPTPTPTPPPSLYPNSAAPTENTSSSWDVWGGLFTLFTGAGSASGSTFSNSLVEGEHKGFLKSELYVHGLVGKDKTSGVHVGSQLTAMRLYLKADFEDLNQSGFDMQSTRLKFGYSFGLGSSALALFLGSYRLKGDYDNAGATLGFAWNWNITNWARSEIVAESTGFGDSSLRQLSGMGQFRVYPHLYIDAGARYSYLTNSALDYTVYFTGLRLNFE